MGFFDFFKKKDMGFIIDNDPVMNRLKNEVDEINNKYDLTETALEDYDYIKKMYKTGLVDPFELTHSVKLNWIKSQIDVYCNKVTSFISDTTLDLENKIIGENDFIAIKDKSGDLLNLIIFEFEKLNEISSPEEASIEIKRIKTLIDEKYNLFVSEINQLYKRSLTSFCLTKFQNSIIENEKILDTYTIENGLELDVVIKKKSIINEFVNNTKIDIEKSSKYITKDGKESFLTYTEKLISLHRATFDKELPFFLEDSNNFKKFVSIWGNDIAKKIYNKEVWIKMNNEQLLSSRGEPTNVEKELTVESTIETWIYGNKNTGNYFVLVDGIVSKIVDR